MPKLARGLFVAALAATVVACTTPDAADPVDTAAEAEAIAAISDAWMVASNANDAEAIANLFAMDGVTIFDGEFIEGREAILANNTASFADRSEGATISWERSTVHVAASGDLAYERGHFIQDADGEGEGAPVEGEYVTVWVKIDGEWKAMVDAGTESVSSDDDEGM